MIINEVKISDIMVETVQENTIMRQNTDIKINNQRKKHQNRRKASTSLKSQAGAQPLMLCSPLMEAERHCIRKLEAQGSPVSS